MELQLREIVFGTVWDVRPYGLMINVDGYWGLLHRSNIPISRIKQILNLGHINDTLLLRISGFNGESISFQYVDPRNIDIKDQFENKYKNSKFTINKVLSNEVYEVKISHSKLRNNLFGIINKKDYVGLASFESLNVGSEVELTVVGFDLNRKRLICSSIVNKVQNTIQIPAKIENESDISQHSYKAHLSKIHLNAIEFNVDGLGSIILPFKDIKNITENDKKALETKINKDFYIKLNNQNDIYVDESLYAALIIHKEEKIKKEILIIGASGSGKSTIINSLCFYDHGRYGVLATDSIYPATQDFFKVELSNFILWDTPGFGTGIQNDLNLGKQIVNWIKERKDSVLHIVLVFDANSRDYGSTFRILNIIKNNNVNFICCINKIDSLFPYGVFGKYILERPIQDKCRNKIINKCNSVKERVKNVLGKEVLTISVSAEITNSTKSFNLKTLIEVLGK